MLAGGTLVPSHFKNGPYRLRIIISIKIQGLILLSLLITSVPAGSRQVNSLND